MNQNRSFKIAAIFLITSFFYHSTQAQTQAQIIKPAKADSAKISRAQNVFVEFGGPGLYFSANYDTRFSKQRGGIGGRAGFGFIADNGTSFSSIPIQLNYLIGKDSKYFEVGIGATYVYYKAPGNFTSDIIYFNRIRGGSSTVLGTMTFGYRYQPIEGGFSFRASFNPLFNSSSFEPYAGISFGFTLNNHKPSK